MGFYAVPNGAPAWKIRIAGDTTDYNPLARVQTAKVNNGVVVIKSLVWPGLCTVYSVRRSVILEQSAAANIRGVRIQVQRHALLPEAAAAGATGGGRRAGAAGAELPEGGKESSPGRLT